MDNYPIGAKYDKNAPYNQIDQPKRKLLISVGFWVEKEFEVEVDDYSVLEEGIDEDGNYYEDIDYSSCNLYPIIEECKKDIPKDWSILDSDYEIIDYDISCT